MPLSALAILQQRRAEEKFLEENSFWESGILVWCEPDDHPFYGSIHSAKRPFSYSSLSSNHPGAIPVKCGMKFNEFRPPNNTDDLCLHVCLFLLLYAPYLDGYRNSSGLVNCSGLPNTVNPAGEESCLFELSQLGECADYPYGYVIQPGTRQLIEPCFHLKFNKVYHMKQRF